MKNIIILCMSLIILLNVYSFIFYPAENTFSIPVKILLIINSIFAVLLTANSIQAEKALNSSSLEEFEKYDKIFEKLKYSHIFLLISLVAVDLVKAIDAFLNKQYVDGIIDILVAIFLIWTINKTGNDLKKKIKKELGEKSKALRDKLAAVQEGMRPQPEGV